MFFYLYFFWGKDLNDSAFFISDECCTEGSHVGSASHLFLSPHTQLVHQSMFGIADERKG